MEYKFTTATFEKEVLQSELPVLVDFYADWCGPCRAMAPVVESLAESYEGKVKIGKCNIDDEMEVAQKYGIMTIPTFMIFKNGEVMESSVGSMDQEVLEEKLKKYM